MKKKNKATNITCNIYHFTGEAMKRHILCILIAALFLVACESNRPSGSGTFTVSLDGRSILKEGTVTVLKGDAELASTTTDSGGLFTVNDLATSATLTVKICGGKFYSAGTESDISFNGCLMAEVPVTQSGKETVYIDWISALAFAYTSDTAREEVLAYLQLDKQAATVLEETLTDATKQYLWQQAFALVARDISVANDMTPETSLSTEALFTLVLADLADNNTIDGSTGAKFGPVLPVNEALIRQHIAGATAEVSAKFTATDLADWVAHLRSAKAKFLGAGGEESDDLTDDATGTDTDKASDPDEESL